jgi:hypothetical protein
LSLVLAWPVAAAAKAAYERVKLSLGTPMLFGELQVGRRNFPEILIARRIPA